MISPTPELIDEIRRGRMIVLADAEDRENEGDLVLAADFVPPDGFGSAGVLGFDRCAVEGEADSGAATAAATWGARLPEVGRGEGETVQEIGPQIPEVPAACPAGRTPPGS